MIALCQPSNLSVNSQVDLVDSYCCDSFEFTSYSASYKFLSAETFLLGSTFLFILFIYN